MEKQWTTVSETVRKAQQDARESLTPSKEDVRKNRRIATALASTGVFLILIGAAPFLFGDNDSSDYAAFLGQDPEVAINAVPVEGDAVGVPPFDLSDDLIDFGDEPEPFDVPPPSPTADPIDTSVPVVPSPPPEAATPTPEITPIPTAIPTTPPEEVIVETVEFPINIHVGGSEAPKDFSQLEMGGDGKYFAAPESPNTGAPVLPLLLFSGAAAAFWRRRMNKNKLN